MQLVAPARFLDGVVFAVFLLFVSGAGLFIFGEFHKMIVITQAKKMGVFATAMDAIFPFSNKQYAFNLTHILLFAILVSLLSMTHHPAQDMLQAEAKAAKKAQKGEKADAEKDKEKAAKGE
mmetsp:Transcript_12272/g.23837  ORF Transcript_12272/g.23837 Transcript_12272/m.23837 type:complete len:121 (-) Transcript_12272:71-433(-)|eukprot:CAMPEP_0172720664 /NCGR_PEP_ID=MMETSP1074-20121228/77387_1 /TAXON_ID=2916 /ORGANISM="Ceratium fusus, Strain PA161109" /LENGTH=120 /DNA_ID=CAMNT_0013546225 /DNA_START=63 /DNA_END=425 /DNA_ORIENTATION=+